jgi:hypothetical protein
LEETRRRRICNIIPRALGRGYVQEKDEERGRNWKRKSGRNETEEELEKGRIGCFF